MPSSSNFPIARGFFHQAFMADKESQLARHGGKAMRSLIVEDNPGIAAGIRHSLEGLDHAVDRAASLSDACDLAAVADYDLVVLDLNLGNDDGLDFLRHLRGSGKPVGVLILTARGGLQDRVRGLDLGADDYLAKPFELAEFEARIRALARRVGGIEAPLIRLGELSFDTARRRGGLGTRRAAHQRHDLSRPATARGLAAVLWFGCAGAGLDRRRNPWRSAAGCRRQRIPSGRYRMRRSPARTMRLAWNVSDCDVSTRTMFG